MITSVFLFGLSPVGPPGRLAARWRWRGFPGKREIKSRALLQFAFGPDLAAVRLDDMLDNRQPQARAAEGRQFVLGLPE